MSRISFNKMEEPDKTEYCYLVYRTLCDQNADPALLPFPMGIDRLRFPSYRIMIQGQDGGHYPGPTIKGLISKIVTAHMTAWLDKSSGG